MHGYFGPEGTFTHQALLTLAGEQGFEASDAKPFATVAKALDAVRLGEVSASLVPIENSVEGGVSATLDNLASPLRPLQIIAEVVIPVAFDLCVRPGTELSQIRTVISHPHAIAQTRGWLGNKLPNAQIVERGSTAGAAQLVADQESGMDAAVCARIAGQIYGLESAATNISDNEAALTRFVLVAKPGQLPKRTGHDKTTLVAYIHQDRPGALLDILQQFAVRGVNLCRIESRPAKTTLGEYCFSMDAEGHVLDERLSAALQGLKRTCRDVHFLGSYARADREPADVPFGGSDEEYREAREWITEIRTSVGDK